MYSSNYRCYSLCHWDIRHIYYSYSSPSFFQKNLSRIWELMFFILWLPLGTPRDLSGVWGTLGTLHFQLDHGRTDRQTEGQTDIRTCWAASSQLKTALWLVCKRFLIDQVSMTLILPIGELHWTHALLSETTIDSLLPEFCNSPPIKNLLFSRL